jgi:nicotinate dehydrogenase subunit B
MNTLFRNGLEPERYELNRPGAGRWTLSRRDFVSRLGGGIVVLLFAATAVAQESGRSGGRSRGRGANRPKELSAWIHIDASGNITIFTGKAEVGQNVRTSLTLAAAEELHAAPVAIRVVTADTDLVPPDMGTFGSRSTPDMFPQIRKVAATAREVLVDLAAARWKTPAADLTVSDSKVWNKDKSQSLTFGDLSRGEKLTAEVNDSVSLTAPSNWQVIGKPLTKVNALDIVTGKHKYTPDQSLPETLHGKILRPPRFGARLQSADSSAAEKLAGVQVIRDGDFLGVVAPDEFSAASALKAIKAEWTGGESKLSSETLFTHLKKSSNKGGEPIENKSEHRNPDNALVLSASYTVAYIAHSPLEPRAALAEWKGDKLTVWTGTQRPFGVCSELADFFKVPEKQVRVIVPDTGSGYGGKHSGEAAVEAARLARAGGKPVKLVWTREEEFTWAYFRPAGLIEVRAVANAAGKLQSWEFDNYNSGASGIRVLYDVPNPHTEFHSSKSPLRQGSYRGLAATANHFARESAIDELAHAAGIDPLEFRLRNATDPRLRAVIQAAAKAFGWQRKSEAGHGHGIAAGSEKGSYLATCAEVVVKDGKLKVLKVVQTFECGAVVNPLQLRNQNEGAIMMGLGGALREEILFENGRVTNPRFSEYEVPRFSDAPEIEIVLVNRPDLPSAGAGETPIVGIAPALANALFAATGIRKRSMPFGKIT